ncbi:MAG: lactate utilization protein [Planctomycetales bacterium]|nr:lactate utilization protein [Planctomycetales bacterium]
MSHLPELLDRIRGALADGERLPYPAGEPEGRPDLAGADRESLAARISERLDALRGPGDREPAVLRVPDAAAALRTVREALEGVPRAEVLLPGDAREPRDYRAGVTGALALVAETGSVLLEVPDRDSAWASLAVETHWVVAGEDLLVPDLVTVYSGLAARAGLAARSFRRENPTNLVQVTGSSRTADVEKIVVVPAHGPTRLRVVLSREPVPAAALRTLAG